MQSDNGISHLTGTVLIGTTMRDPQSVDRQILHRYGTCIPHGAIDYEPSNSAYAVNRSPSRPVSSAHKVMACDSSSAPLLMNG